MYNSKHTKCCYGKVYDLYLMVASLGLTNNFYLILSNMKTLFSIVSIVVICILSSSLQGLAQNGIGRTFGGPPPKKTAPVQFDPNAVPKADEPPKKDGYIYLDKGDGEPAEEQTIDLTTASLTKKQVEKRMKSYFYKGNYNGLTAAAKDNNKPYVLVFYTDWCRVCKQVDRETFANQEVMDYLGENYFMHRINPEKTNPELATKYKVESFPVYLFFNARGQEMGRITGYMEKNTFLKMAKKYKPKVPNTTFSRFR